MSCFHCALKRGCECATATIPHNNTLGGIQLENYTSSVLLAEVILHTNTHIYTHTALKHQTAAVERKSAVSTVEGFADRVFGDACAC